MYLNILGFCLFAFKAILLKATRLQLKTNLILVLSVSVWEKEWRDCVWILIALTDGTMTRSFNLAWLGQRSAPGSRRFPVNTFSQMPDGSGFSTAPTLQLQESCFWLHNVARTTQSFSVSCLVPERKDQVTSFAPWLKTIANSHVMTKYQQQCW